MRSKLLVPIFMIIILIGMVSAAWYNPLPINGKVEGPQVAGLPMEVTNLRTGIVMVTKTTGVGEYMVEWANSDDKGGTITRYRPGDNFRIRVIGCDESGCTKTRVYTGEEDEIYTVMTIEDLCIPPECEVCATCETCEECEVCEECEDNDTLKVTLTAIIALIGGALAAMGGGMKFYKNKLGQIVGTHRHKGVRGYHDMNTSHRNTNYRHARLKDNPIKFANDVKVINEEGGLD